MHRSKIIYLHQAKVIDTNVVFVLHNKRRKMSSNIRKMMQTTTTFEAIIAPMLLVMIVMYMAWDVGRKEGRKEGRVEGQIKMFATTNGNVNSESVDATVGDKDAESTQGGAPMGEPAKESESDLILSTLDDLSASCDRCAHPDHQCSDACTSQEVVETCEKLNGYVNLPRTPCPLQGEGLRSYAMFRSESRVV